MTTLAQLEVTVARALRDTARNTWDTTELDDLINQGIDVLSELSPREIVQTVGTVAASTYSYSVSAFTSVYRLDVYTSGGSYSGQIEHGIGGADTGWEVHGGVIYLPPNWLPSTGSTLRAWGYAAFTQLSATSSVTDLTPALIHSLVVFCQGEAASRLLNDRAMFGQWQADPANSDATLLGLNQTAFRWRRRWEEEARRLRRLRKQG